MRTDLFVPVSAPMAGRKTRRARLKRIAFGRPDGQSSDRNIAPTPETLKKLEKDVISTLFEEAALTSAQRDAALEIRGIHEAIGRGMFARSAVNPAAVRGGPQYGPRDFTHKMSVDELDRWENRYLPWSHDLAVAVVSGMPRTRWLQLVIDIVVDNVSITAVESRYRLAAGSGLRYLAEGLDRFSEARNSV